MPNRYIYAGLYEDRDGDLKDIFYTFKQKKNGEWFIHFRGENGASFRWWNTGRSKIDMITWDAEIQRLWAHKLALDGSWIPGEKMRGLELRYRELKRLIDDGYNDPYDRHGRTVTQLGPRVNTAHTGANAIPGGARAGNVWIDPGEWDNEDEDSDTPDVVQPDSDDDEDSDGDEGGEGNENESDEGLFVSESDQDAAIPIEDSDVDSDDDDDEEVRRRSNIRKGKQKARAAELDDADEPPAHPFTGFFGRIAGRMSRLSSSSSPSPPPQIPDPIDLTGGEEERPQDRGRSRSLNRVVDLSENENRNVITDRTIIDLTADDIVIDLDVPIASIEEDEDDDIVKIESRRSTPYRMRLESGSLRTRSQSPVRIYSHTPDSVQIPSSWTSRSRPKLQRSSSVSSSIRTRIKFSPSSPTPRSSTLRCLRERRMARFNKTKDTSQAEIEEISSSAVEKDQPSQNVTGEASSSSVKRRLSRPIIVADLGQIIVIDD